MLKEECLTLSSYLLRVLGNWPVELGRTIPEGESFQLSESMYADVGTP